MARAKSKRHGKAGERSKRPKHQFGKTASFKSASQYVEYSKSEQNNKRRNPKYFIELLNTAIKNFPRHAGLYNQRAVWHEKYANALLWSKKSDSTSIERQKALQNAEHDFKRSIELEPNAVDALNDYGRFLRRQDRFTNAEEMFHKALVCDPHSFDTLMRLGYLYANIGKPELALVCYSEATKVTPSRKSDANGRIKQLLQNTPSDIDQSKTWEDVEKRMLRAIYAEHKDFLMAELGFGFFTEPYLVDSDTLEPEPLSHFEQL